MHELTYMSPETIISLVSKCTNLGCFLKSPHAFLDSLRPFDLVLPEVTELAGELDSPPLLPVPLAAAMCPLLRGTKKILYSD